MASHSINSKRMNSDMVSDNNLQKPNIYNKFSPFYEFINEQSSMLFDEIRENLSRTIQLGELDPGFTIWSNKLKRFVALYGFNFTKVDHLKLINFYLSILSITNLNYRYVEICFDMLSELMRFVSNSFDIKEQSFVGKLV
jgi:proteasome activator subunit 4